MAHRRYRIEVTSTPKRQNRLAQETSPYLLQHADNPVDWYPWGDEALERARLEDKPVLLSVGYSACHWCHVMAHESFENEATAALMNANYVNIKVDREERPDIDGVYMTAVQALTGQGGWPMTVFMTPDGKPFYAGTYFPPEDGYGRPGFPRVLEAIAEKWRADRAEVLNSADSIVAHLRQASERTPTDRGELTLDFADRAAETFRENFDAVWGGFGMAPKFPSPGNLEFLLAHATRIGDGELLEMVVHTLRRMATGGMYDQLGGGLRSLQRRRALARPALRKDVVRQRSARPRLSARLADHAGTALRTCGPGNAGLSRTRDARPRGRLLRRPGRRQRRHRGQVFRLDANGDRIAPGRRCSSIRRLLRSNRRGQFPRPPPPGANRAKRPYELAGPRGTGGALRHATRRLRSEGCAASGAALRRP